MDYRKRMYYAAALSVAVHLCAFAVGAYEFDSRGSGLDPAGEPLIISLKPLKNNKIQKLIQSGATADEGVKDTDMISDRASKAQDLSDEKGKNPQPFFEESSESDELGAAAVLAEAIAPESSPPDTVSEKQRETPESNVDELVTESTESVKTESPISVLAEPEPAPEPEPEVEEPPETFEVARAQEQPLPLVQDLRATRGREGGAADASGFTSFEANRHALGGYMLEIRKHVEREWRMAIQLKYSGASHAYAVLKCSITPEGKLEFVTIIDPGDSLAYAAMCKRAVETAAQYFRAFPFEVPDIYRQENLEIQWKFTYM